MPVTIKSYASKLTRWTIIVGVILILVAGWIWYKRVYLSNERVFWATISNSLTTNSVTRQSQSTAQQQSSNQFTKLQAGAQKASETLSTVIQTGSGNSLTRQTLGTPTADYARYLKINTGQLGANGQPVDYSSVEGLWGKGGIQSNGRLPSQYFNQAILGTIPTANLSQPAREALLKTMHEKDVFQVDFSKVDHKKDNGNSVYVYNVKIQAKPYFEMMQQFVKLMGLDSSIVPNPNDYQNVSPLEIQLYIKPTARQIAKIHYVSNNQDESYSAYGESTPIALPTQTVSLTELQNRIQQLQQ